ncbi:adenylosuccinate lyase [Buchnera aphidicola str. Bp (Baizongia pistaciae)]|uniref:Adenylosuccinate lyase n=1 Tax=Buchnera aphidicola subsp. Baizongia pistaciae (strain Bp) TaxID=224915 RepID=PUR8_BUCBP|nr:adenylosuccinate lyase [Buchnera aphidicola]Q89AM3.1 RecName: Full=Adenylosuccinate lyase; Short=ASL; AltName: Full=Adenylosuccinase; Short=ASase [Buchnera aphidicola str. Bp (Baizongia pistaciae)]AAO26971.1 adenylosuccinate lyase [Buchnera aphidicola str. Bp (Baizongia pistaciae)]
MIASPLFAISPIDGRYSSKVIKLRNIFSEYAFLKFRVTIELLWLKKISLLQEFKIVYNKDVLNCLDRIIDNFSKKDALEIKILEKKTNHDVKSIEYFLQKKIFKCLGNHDILGLVHFGCTSEDINNLAYALMLKVSRRDIILPLWNKIIFEIKKIALLHHNVPMLSRTHGQPATPSTIGKELINFAYRLERQLKQFKNIEILGKINGSTGNYNALHFSHSSVDWHKISQEFVTSLGLFWNPYTTQIEPHDFISEFFSCLARVNTILINFNRDIWGYISLQYFNQTPKLDEIGSSVMPHKINPIDFENSEGNLGLSNAIISHLIEKLPISRWQRDLSDSTVLRNVGTVIAYSIIAYDSIILGLKKLKVNTSRLLQDLNHHWEILAEPIQTVMRKYGINDTYNELKNITRGKRVTSDIILKYVNSLKIPRNEKEKLLQLTPENYLGLSSKLVKIFNNSSELK